MGKGKKQKIVRGSGDQESFKKFKKGDDEAFEDPAVRRSVDADLRAVREAADAAAAPQPESSIEEVGEEQNNAAPSDPYLLADAKYIQKDTRWRNKQRTLVFCSRGVSSRFRHLTDDIRKLLPHHKAEPKFEKSMNLNSINEVCELRNCNNVIYFEAKGRTERDLYMYIARVPSGPTLKFQVLNIHTTGEVRLAGNCLHGSRPILSFDKHFDQLAELKLFKTLLVQVWGTPRNHPKSKPFHDHVCSFYYLDKKIWFRHYQIAPETHNDHNDAEHQVLTEMGPRLVLDPIKFLSGSFSGQTLFANPHYYSPTALRVQAKKLLSNPYRRKLSNRSERKARMKDNEESDDPLDEAFV
jgi:ribosome biogenesis protein BRX1